MSEIETHSAHIKQPTLPSSGRATTESVRSHPEAVVHPFGLTSDSSDPRRLPSKTQ